MPRRAAAFIVYVLTAGAVILGGQHAAPGTPANAAGSHASASPEHTATAPAAPTHEAAPPAAPADARPAPPPGQITTGSQKAARPAAAEPANIQTIVERIQQRIDAEVVKPAAARATRAPRARGAAAPARRAAVDRRIRLSWRVSLVWPPELASD